MKTQPAVLQAVRDDRIAVAHLVRGMVHKHDTVLDAARSILSTQYIEIRANLQPMQAKVDPVYLHDFRVAMRRFRTALKFFAPELKGTGAKRLAGSLADLSSLVSSIRDSQAWMEFLESSAVIAACEGDPLWTTYVADRRRHMRRQSRRLRGICAKPVFAITMMRMHALLRSTLPRLEGTHGTRPFRGFAAERLSETYATVAALGGDLFTMKPDALHQRRRRYRRARYLSEFVLPVLGGTVAECHRMLKRQASALGVIHDVDVHLLATRGNGTDVPPALRAYGIQLRQASLERATAGQVRLAGKKFRREMHSLLSTG